VDGQIDPQFDIVLSPGEEAVLGVHGDGQTPTPVFVFLLVQGPGTINGSRIIYTGTVTDYFEREEFNESLSSHIPDIPGLNDASWFDLGDIYLAPPLEGLLVDGINFSCEGIGEVMLSLVNADLANFGDIYDTQTIHQIPEPTAFMLLGIGCYLIRKRHR
jgi:hypothetical protein